MSPYQRLLAELAQAIETIHALMDTYLEHLPGRHYGPHEGR